MDIQNGTDLLFKDVKKIIEESRKRLASMFDAEKTILYWSIGQRVKSDVLDEQRAEYGKQIVEQLSFKLTQEYGPGWSPQQLRHCVHLATVFADESILSTLWRELSWSHIKTIMYIDEPIKRDFYIEMTKLNRWNVQTLQEKKRQLLFERTASIRKPEELITKELNLLKDEKVLSPNLVFHDPIFLSCLGITNVKMESELEDAIVDELQAFIQEMGSDFAFMARQKLMMIDNKNYSLDLLFFHRRLHCLVAIDLKLGEFDAAYKGEMELYLRWLEKYEMAEGENTPIGLILCSGKSEEHIELLKLDDSNIRVAEYLMKLPDMRLLEKKLKQSIEIAREKITANEEKACENIL
ncbi:MAG: PDDEXK nuclease domain-containing protein [Clostridiales Family XIII bacterium]|jgi:predicted nuclease of restriction endonuclease-like (RecB) superfamily|nr:PDDEXK nuclease domain-containing protein [Clostridiales Family XIII bacterium]